MRKISIQEMFNLMNQFQGRQIEVDLSPVQSANTYHWFSVKEVNDAVIFSDKDHNHPQELRFFKDDIEDILYSEGNNLFDSVFTINLKNDQQIQVCVYEEPERCFVCNEIVNLNLMQNVWEVNGVGGYSSHFDGERLSMKICDDCMFEIVYGERYVDLENGLNDCGCNGLEILH